MTQAWRQSNLLPFGSSVYSKYSDLASPRVTTMLRMKCPHCRKFLGVEEAHAGALGVCPACCETFTIPVPAVLLDDPPSAEVKPPPPTMAEEEIVPGRPLLDSTGEEIIPGKPLPDSPTEESEPLPELTEADIVPEAHPAAPDKTLAAWLATDFLLEGPSASTPQPPPAVSEVEASSPKSLDG